MNLNQLIFKPFILVLVMPTALMVPALANNDPVQGNLPKILSQRTSGDREYLPDFSYAGYRNGAEELPAASGKVILVDEFGAQADDEADEDLLQHHQDEHDGRDGHVAVHGGDGGSAFAALLDEAPDEEHGGHDPEKEARRDHGHTLVCADHR